ncbi:MAG: YggS family pyridoxal phosphate-dependent enzyme [Candidatus Omnitrophota bacterium]|jgi:hypothetical protein
MTEELRERLGRLAESISRAAARCGRDPGGVQWVLVTKTVPAARIREAWDLGAREFGENRVQELLEKQAGFPEEARWHLIGHLQTNKVRQVLGRTVLIHSVDRIEVVREIEKQAEKKGIAAVEALIQVNMSREASKSGVLPEEAEALAAGIAADSPLKIRGLMTIGPLTDDEARIREAFRGLRKMGEDFRMKFPDKSWGILSMGMSQDFEIAIEEGATLLRIGSLVFGARS